MTAFLKRRWSDVAWLCFWLCLLVIGIVSAGSPHHDARWDAVCAADAAFFLGLRLMLLIGKECDA